jgi:hypothetical protein
VCLSILPHITTQKAMNTFSWHSLLGGFIENCYTVQFWLHSGNINGYFVLNSHACLCTCPVCDWIFVRVKNILNENCREKLNICLMLNTLFCKPYWIFMLCGSKNRVNVSELCCLCCFLTLTEVLFNNNYIDGMTWWINLSERSDKDAVVVMEGSGFILPLPVGWEF